MIHTRRQFLLLTAGAFFQPGTQQAAPEMVIRSVRPADLEMPLEGFSDFITPVDRFFVRTHVYTPRIDPSEWRLQVDGDVETPLTLTLEDIRRMPAVELVSVLECAGNGRRFYEPSVPGLQWGHGAIGNGRWRGIRLADVLRQAGISATAKEVLFDGADVALGTMPDFQRSIPVTKALDSSTLLAYEMNGQTLPVKHGYPLRVVVPGWAGDSWMKWVTSISVLNREHDGFWMARAYRHPGRPVFPGTVIPPEQMQPVTSLRVKSVIAAPVDGSPLPAGKPVVIRGAAWSGDAGPVTAVEVSVDGGRRWIAARLQRNQQTKFGWRLWELTWTPSRDAYYTILARARDAAGDTQPFDQEWNPSGYGWNVIPRVGVNVGSGPAPEATPIAVTAPALAPPPAFKSACLACHEDDVIRQQRLTRPQWEAEINKMIGWGAKVTDQDRIAVLEFLARSYGPRPR